MSAVVVSAEWMVSEGPATESDQSLLADALADGDPCVWVEADHPDVLVATFDVEASDLDIALLKGREVFLAATRGAGLSGSLARLTAADEEGFLSWPSAEAMCRYAGDPRGTADDRRATRITAAGLLRSPSVREGDLWGKRPGTATGPVKTRVASG